MSRGVVSVLDEHPAKVLVQGCEARGFASLVRVVKSAADNDELVGAVWCREKGAVFREAERLAWCRMSEPGLDRLFKSEPDAGVGRHVVYHKTHSGSLLFMPPVLGLIDRVWNIHVDHDGGPGSRADSFLFFATEKGEKHVNHYLRYGHMCPKEWEYRSQFLIKRRAALEEQDLNELIAEEV